MYSNSPPKDDEDDATRIYRPYGSPPPEAADLPPLAAPTNPFGDAGRGAPPADPFGPGLAGAPEEASTAAPPDPFAPRDPFASPGPADPFQPAEHRSAAPDPFAPASFAPDPFAPPSHRPDAPDFPPAAVQNPYAPAAADPFAPVGPFVPASPPDPFAPAARHAGAPAGPDPFAPPAADPFAPDPFAPAARDPFQPAVPPVHETFSSPPPAQPPAYPPAAPDVFAPATQAPDPFAPATHDPFYGAAPRTSAAPSPDPFQAAARDPFQAPARSAFAPTTPDPFDLGPRPSAPQRRAQVAPVAPLPPGSGRLSDAFASVFALVLQLRGTSDFGDPTALRERAEALLDRAVAQARAGGDEPADIREAEFCLVAFLDEAVLTSEWPGRDGWAATPLQLSRYERYDAGEAFFDRLKLLLNEGGREEVLEVYYLCIALGYKGRYQIHGREVLGQLVGDLQARLARAPGGTVRALAPHALPRGPVAEAQAGGIPTWALFAGAAVLVLLVYLALSVSVSGIARDVARDVSALPVSGADAAPASRLAR